MFSWVILLVALVWATQGREVPWTKVDFSVKRGFYDKPISLQFTSPFTNSQIRYTISKGNDWNNARIEPSSTVGSLYTAGASITISETSIVKAFAWNNTLKSNITIHSFIFPKDVIRQSTMNQALINDARYAAGALPGLVTFPTLSVTSMIPYPTYTDKGRPYYKTFLEWIDPSGVEASWHAGAGVEIYGGYSVNYPKKNLRFHFQEEFGTDGLEYPLFDGFDWGVGATKVIKAISVRSHSQDGIEGRIHGWFPVTWMKNIWHDWAVQDIGAVAPHSRYCHMYYNGQYMGIHHVRERMNTHFFTEYFGGARTQYCAVSKGNIYDGPATCPYNGMINNIRWNYLKNYLDVNSFIDYALLTHYGGNIDLAYQHNWQAGGPIAQVPWNGKDAGWKFFLSDQDATFFFANVNENTLRGGYLANMWVGLTNEADPEFMLKVQDRIWRHYISPRGDLVPAAVRERFDRIQTIFGMNNSLIVELARWGYRFPDYNMDQWNLGINQIYSYYIPIRTGIVLSQYRAAGWMNPLGAPSFDLEDGELYENNTKLTISYLSGSRVIFTTDGTDPRLTGGAINPKAITVSTPYTMRLTETTTFWARVYQGNVWSPLEKMTFRIDYGFCYLCGKLVISEVHYNPTVERTGFIEVKNIHNKAINLNGAYFTGIRYTFPPVWLNPGAFFVIGDTLEPFKAKYGKYPDDHFWLTLDQAQASIQLKDPAKNKIHNMEYSDTRPWSEYADGFGYSLVPRGNNYTNLIGDTETTSAKHWQPSATKDGSPWRDDGVPGYFSKINLKITEIVSDPGAGKVGWVEIYNPGPAAVNLYQWLIAEEYKVDDKTKQFSFPNGVSIAAGAYATYDANYLKWAPSLSGGKYVLFGAACCAVKDPKRYLNTGEWIERSYDRALTGVSQGWYKTSKGVEKWGMLSAQTAGSGAQLPYRSPVVIAGIVPFVDRLTTPTFRNTEYIRLQNWHTAAVNINGWELRIGDATRVVCKLTGTLNPQQNLYVTHYSDANGFKGLLTLAARDPTARVQLCAFGSNLFTKIDIEVPVPPDNKFVNVEHITLDQRFVIPKKRSIEDIEEVVEIEETEQASKTPAELARQSSTLYDADDPASWKGGFLIPPPIDCTFNDFTDWPVCPVTCGGATITRSRTKNAEQFGGKPCVGALSESRACGTKNCPIDCVWHEWGNYTACEVTCGGSTELSARTYTPEKYGGKPCIGPEYRTRDCATNPCPIDCTLGSWSEWSWCTMDCDGGSTSRERNVTSEAMYGGSCVGNLTDVAACNTQACYPAFSIALLVIAGCIVLLLLGVILYLLFAGGAVTESAADTYTNL